MRGPDCPPHSRVGEEAVGDGHQHARAVTRVLLAAARAAVRHADQHVERVHHALAADLAVQVAHEADLRDGRQEGGGGEEGEEGKSGPSKKRFQQLSLLVQQYLKKGCFSTFPSFLWTLHKSLKKEGGCILWRGEGQAEARGAR